MVHEGMMLVSMVAFYFYFYIEMTLAIDMESNLSMKAMNGENQLLVIDEPVEFET